MNNAATFALNPYGGGQAPHHGWSGTCTAPADIPRCGIGRTHSHDPLWISCMVIASPRRPPCGTDVDPGHREAATPMYHWLGITGGVLGAAQFGPHIVGMVRRRTRPQRATWAIWTALSVVIFTAQLAQGADASLWMPAAQMAGNTAMCLLALRYGTGGCTRRDIQALAIAGVGLILWGLTQDALSALLTCVAVDAIAAWLTINKAYHHPRSEPMPAWILSDLSGVCAALAVGRLTVPLLAYPIYVALANSAVIGAILRGRRIESPPSAGDRDLAMATALPPHERKIGT